MQQFVTAVRKEKLRFTFSFSLTFDSKSAPAGGQRDGMPGLVTLPHKLWANTDNNGCMSRERQVRCGRAGGARGAVRGSFFIIVAVNVDANFFE